MARKRITTKRFYDSYGKSHDYESTPAATDASDSPAATDVLGLAEIRVTLLGLRSIDKLPCDWCNTEITNKLYASPETMRVVRACGFDHALQSHREYEYTGKMSKFLKRVTSPATPADIDSSESPDVQALINASAALQAQFWQSLTDLESALGFEVDSTQELQGLTAGDLKELAESDSKSDNEDSLESLAEKLDVDTESLYSHVSNSSDVPMSDDRLEDFGNLSLAEMLAFIESEIGTPAAKKLLNDIVS